MHLKIAGLGLIGLAIAANPVVADAPPDVSRASAIPPLPARINGTLKQTARAAAEPPSPCGDATDAVWYRFDPGVSRRVVARLVAAGDLDATFDVFLQQRSDQRPVTCDQTGGDGRAAVAFDAVRGRRYLLRVSRRTASRAGAFRLTVAPARGQSRLPGTPLAKNGAGGTLDRVDVTTQAWSTSLHAGVRYRIAVSPPTGGCIAASVYGPHPRPGARAVAKVGCRGYGLFTPRVGRGGRYAIQVRAQRGRHGDQRYRLQVAPTTADDSAPGVFIPNFARVGGHLDAHGVDRTDLYRFDVIRRSVLFLQLRTRARFDLVLLDQWGDVIRCGCDRSGNQAFHKGLRPGRFFVAIRARSGAGDYTLLRASRVITKSHIRVDDADFITLAPGQPATVSVLTSPAVNGPVTVVFEQFDPLSDWQFTHASHAFAHGGVATVQWTPPTVGRWRATATFDGTRANAPSATGFARMLVAGPLSE